MKYSNNFFICSLAENSDLSAQNALDLLLNMSNARDLVGNTLQVSAMTHQNVLEAHTVYGKEESNM